MLEVRCKACGSNDLTEDNGFFTCSYCGTKFKREASETGAASIDQEENIRRLLERAELYWSGGMQQRAKRIYEQVLELDAKNPIARQRI